MINEKELIKGLENLADIYRDKLSKAEDREHMSFLKGAIGAMIEVTDIIRNWPKVGEWIPVEERLPEPYEQVLVYTKGGHFCIATYFKEHKRWWFGSYWENLDFVIEWQPLPEPYEVKDND